MISISSEVHQGLSEWMTKENAVIHLAWKLFMVIVTALDQFQFLKCEHLHYSCSSHPPNFQCPQLAKGFHCQVLLESKLHHARSTCH